MGSSLAVVLPHGIKNADVHSHTDSWQGLEFFSGAKLFLLIRVATGGEVRVSRIITAFSLALVASIFGGVLGSIMQNSGVRPK